MRRASCRAPQATAEVLKQAELSAFAGKSFGGWARVGFESVFSGADQGRLQLIYDSPQPKPMMLVLMFTFWRASDIVVPDHVCRRLFRSPPIVMVSAIDSVIVAPERTNQNREITAGVLLVGRTSSCPRVSRSIRDLRKIPSTSFVVRGADTAMRKNLRKMRGPCSVKPRQAGAKDQAVCAACATFHSVSARAPRRAWETFNERRGVCRAAPILQLLSAEA